MLAFFIMTNSEGEFETVRVQGCHKNSSQDTVLSTRAGSFKSRFFLNTLFCMRPELQTESRAIFKIFRRYRSNHLQVRHLHLGLSKASAEKIWWSWMTSYLKRHFPFQEDRLPALSSFVQNYQDTIADRNILRLWEISLPKDLLWMRVGPVSEENSTTNMANVPSW